MNEPSHTRPAARLPARPTAEWEENPWAVQEWAFPIDGSLQDQLRFLLHYAVLAPSGHNTQPWLFEIAGDEVALYADRSRALAVVDPGERELLMSCGAALLHLRVALRHFGYEPVVRLFPDEAEPDLLARVRPGAPLEQGPTMEDHRLFMAIPKRRTNRMAFEARPVPDEALDLLRAAARREGAVLHTFQNPDAKGALARLIAEGDRLQGQNRQYRRELAAWVHPNRSRSRDGIPGYAQGVGDLLSYAGPLWVRTFDWGNGQAARDRQLAEGSPLLLVLATEADDTAAHVAAGQALGRVLLTAEAYGLEASYLNQPLQVPALRPRVAKWMGGGVAQLILRMGYGPDVEATPRRPVSAVLLDREPDG